VLPLIVRRNQQSSSAWAWQQLRMYGVRLSDRNSRCRGHLRCLRRYHSTCVAIVVRQQAGAGHGRTPPSSPSRRQPGKERPAPCRADRGGLCERGSLGLRRACGPKAPRDAMARGHDSSPWLEPTSCDDAACY
jgi:hypothetical protein